MAAKPIPDGYHTVTPYLVVKDGGEAIEFYKKAFGAEEIMRMPGPDGKSIMHAEIKIGDSPIMLCGEFPGGKCMSPASLGGTTVTVHLYVTDTDAAHKKALDAGANNEMPPMDMFWGDRFAKVSDPFGHHWSIATHIKDLTPEEMQQGAADFFKNMPDCG